VAGAAGEQIVVGRITAPHGIKGWVKVFSYTDPIEGILDYSPWYLVKGNRRRQLVLEGGMRQGRSLIVLPEGCTDREQAALLTGWEIRIDKRQLPALAAGEYYWHQLEGLTVVNTEGEVLGTVDHLLETGGKDVLLVKPGPASIDDRERLVPFVEDRVVREVDLDGGRILVDWGSDF
jgi:16S rRNA processing protein RimM